MKEPRIEGVIAGHAFDLCSIQDHTFTWFGNIGEPDSCQSGNIFTGVVAVGIRLHAEGFRSGSTAVTAQDFQNTLT